MKFCVIGLGRFGYELATTLAKQGMEVLAIDKDEAIVSSIKDKVTEAVCLEIRDEESLQSINVEEMDTVVVAIGENFEQSVLITALLKKRLKVPNVITRATYEIHNDILRLIGADRVVLPEQYVGKQLAVSLSIPFVELVHITDTFAITHLRAPKGFVGKTLEDLNLLKTRDVVCIAIKKGRDIILVEPEYRIVENDILLLAGENKDLAAIIRI